MTKHEGITRRRMLQLTGVLGASAVLAGCSSQAASTESDSAKESTSASMSVYDPSGSIEISQTFAPRLDGFENKTIAFVADDAWEDDRTFPEIERLLKEKYPTVTVIREDNFIHGIDAITVENNGLPEAMQEKNVDGVIVGNAG